MKKISNYNRAQNMVMQDRFDLDRERFAKDLHGFLSNYFQFDSLAVDVVEGKKRSLVICVNVYDVNRQKIV